MPALQSDAGAPTPDADGPKLRIQDFDAVDASVSWATAPVVPTSQPLIVGGDERLIGTWRQTNCDQTGVTGGVIGCMRLVIDRNAGGTLEGNVNFDPFTALRFPQGVGHPGPFRPPQDPEQGYPSEVAVEAYTDIMFGPQLNVPYRILDGRLTSNHFTFAWSSMDVWHAWCQLQTPHPWQVDDRRFYFCAPQDQTVWPSISEAKLALCIPSYLTPLCDDHAGGRQPCVCVEGTRARCGPAYCYCDSRSCDADLQGSRSLVDLTLDNQWLVGGWRSNATLTSLILTRELP